MKLLLVLVVVALLSACSPSVKPSGYESILQTSPGFEDCKVAIVSDGISTITVVRCPFSSTTVKQPSGKSTKTVVVIDGVEYVKK